MLYHYLPCFFVLNRYETIIPLPLGYMDSLQIVSTIVFDAKY